jgi:hypothetical protein
MKRPKRSRAGQACTTYRRWLLIGTVVASSDCYRRNIGISSADRMILWIGPPGIAFRE